jgi:hypothetical protein
MSMAGGPCPTEHVLASASAAMPLLYVLFSQAADFLFRILTAADQGGLGPSSRMWGSCLDHVLEVEVVTADGKIQRANEAQNPDLFFVSVRWSLTRNSSHF